MGRWIRGKGGDFVFLLDENLFYGERRLNNTYILTILLFPYRSRLLYQTIDDRMN